MLLNNEYMHNFFLYTSNEDYRFTIRIVVRMKAPVRKDALRHALDTAIKRYPYFSVRLVKTADGYDIVPNDKPIVLSESSKPVSLGTAEANDHFIAIGMEGSEIYVDGYHGLTDGNGIMPFISTLLYYYAMEFSGKHIEPKGIRTADEEIPYEETCDPFEKVKNVSAEPLGKYVPEPVFHIDDAVRDTLGEDTAYLIKVSEKSLMDFSKSNDGTPNAMISALFYKAILRNHPDIALPIASGIATTERPALGMEKNYGCLVTFVHIKYPPAVKDYELQKLGTIGRGMIMLQSQPENILATVPGKGQLVQYFKSLPDDRTRQMTFHQFILHSDENNTFTVSYVGKKDFSAIEDYVDSIYSFADPSHNTFLVEINAINGNFDLCVDQSFSDDRYVKTFMEILKEENIEFSYEGKRALTLPKVKVL